MASRVRRLFQKIQYFVNKVNEKLDYYYVRVMGYTKRFGELTMLMFRAIIVFFAAVSWIVS